MSSLYETSSYTRDASSGALLNTDNKALAEHKEKKRMRNDLKNLKERVAKLEDLIAELLEKNH